MSEWRDDTGTAIPFDIHLEQACHFLYVLRVIDFELRNRGEPGRLRPISLLYSANCRLTWPLVPDLAVVIRT